MAMAASSDRANGAASSVGVLIGVYGIAALVGYVCGLHGYFPFRAAGATTSTPLARVGMALREEKPQATAGAWAALRGDVEAVRRAWRAPEPAVFDLVVALRGLNNGGVTEWSRAEELCRELKWRRCDRAALEVMKRSSRP
jgi:hypothetical protein